MALLVDNSVFRISFSCIDQNHVEGEGVLLDQKQDTIVTGGFGDLIRRLPSAFLNSETVKKPLLFVCHHMNSSICWTVKSGGTWRSP